MWQPELAPELKICAAGEKHNKSTCLRITREERKAMWNVTYWSWVVGNSFVAVFFCHLLWGSLQRSKQWLPRKLCNIWRRVFRPFKLLSCYDRKHCQPVSEKFQIFHFQRASSPAYYANALLPCSRSSFNPENTASGERNFFICCHA